MAGDWFPVRTDLMDDPAVWGIANTLKIDRLTVVGGLIRFWSWVDGQLSNCCAPSVTLANVNDIIGATGFAEALVSEGWLEISGDGIKIPKWDKYFSHSAKRRLLSARRMEMLRSRRNISDATSATLVTPRAQQKRNHRTEQKREDKSEYRLIPDVPSEEEKPKPRKPDPLWDAVVERWFADGVAPTHRTRVGKLVRDLKALKATPEEITKRIVHHEHRWPEIAVTPESLVKHWSELAKDHHGANRKPDEPHRIRTGNPIYRQFD